MLRGHLFHSYYIVSTNHVPRSSAALSLFPLFRRVYFPVLLPILPQTGETLVLQCFLTIVKWSVRSTIWISDVENIILNVLTTLFIWSLIRHDSSIWKHSVDVRSHVEMDQVSFVRKYNLWMSTGTILNVHPLGFSIPNIFFGTGINSIQSVRSSRGEMW